MFPIDLFGPLHQFISLKERKGEKNKSGSSIEGVTELQGKPFHLLSSNWLESLTDQQLTDGQGQHETRFLVVSVSLLLLLRFRFIDNLGTENRPRKWLMNCSGWKRVSSISLCKKKNPHLFSWVSNYKKKQKLQQNSKCQAKVAALCGWHSDHVHRGRPRVSCFVTGGTIKHDATE